MGAFSWNRVSKAVRLRLQNRHLMRASGLLLSAYVITSAIGLARTLALTWLLPKEEVGMLAVVGVWLVFLHLLSLPGMDAASYHYIAQGHPWAFRLALGQRLRWSLFSMAGFGVGAAYWLYQGNPQLAWLFLITALLYPLTSGLTLASGTLAARERFTTLFWFRILEALADLVGFLPLLLGLWWLSPVFTYYSTSQAFLAVLLVSTTWWLLQQLRADQAPTPHPVEQQGLVQYGRHQTAISAIGVVQARIDALLVSAFFPLTVMADYSLALLIQSQLKNFWTIYLSVRYPPLVRLSARRRKQRMMWEGTAVTLGFVGAGAALAIAAAVLVPWVLPPTYQNLLPYLNWLIVAFIASMPGNFAEIFFRSEQDEKRQYLMRGVVALLGIVLPLALLPALGLEAIFIGRVATALLHSLLGVTLFLKAQPRPEPVIGGSSGLQPPPIEQKAVK